MDKLNDFIEEFSPSLENFLGFEVNLSIDHNNDLQIHNVDINESIYEICKENIDSITHKVISTLKELYEEHKSFNYRASYKQLLLEELAYSLITGDNKRKVLLANFIETLKLLSVRTYERKNTELGFIIFNKEKEDVATTLSKLDIRYSQFPPNCDINELLSDKQTIKLIDSKSLCFVVNAHYEIIGLAQKTKNSKSLYDIMMSRHKRYEEADIKYLTYEIFKKELPINKEDINNDDIYRLRDNISNSKQRFIESFNKCFQSNYNIDEILEKINEDECKYNYNFFSKEYTKYLNDKIIFAKTAKERLDVLNNMVAGADVIDSFLSDIIHIQKEGLEDIFSLDFAFIKNKQIYWSSTFEHILTYYNGQWKMRNFFLLRASLMQYTISQQFTSLKDEAYKDKAIKLIKKINYSIPRALDTYNILKSLSEKNIGSLICILKRTKKWKKTVYKEMLNKGKLEIGSYKLVIQTDKNNFQNIRGCDPYLFELICSIDGAVIMDHFFDLLSFGEIIKANNKPSNITSRGARTNAAVAASNFGLAIKVSEDGDITVYHGQEKIIRI